MKKEIRFSAKLDTGDFDKTVEQLQRKIKDIYKGSEQSRTQFENQTRMGQTGLGRETTARDRNRADVQDVRTRRELDQFIKQQVKDQEKLTQSVNKQLDVVRQLRKEQESLRRGSQEEIEVKRKIEAMDKSIASTREQTRAKDMAIKEALDRRDDVRDRLSDLGRIGRGFRTGGVRGAMSAGRSVFSNMGTQGMINLGAGALGMVGGAIDTGLNLQADQLALPGQTLARQGNASQFYNQQLERAFSGRNYENMLYAPEMGRAKRLGADQAEAEKKRDTGAVVRNILIGMGIGAAGGAAFLGLGAIPGAIAGGIAGAGGATFLDRDRALGVAGVGKYGDAYNALQEQRKSSFTAEALEAQKNLSPFKRMTMDDFGQNMMPNLMAQRALGFNDQDLFGLYGRGTGAGFTRGMTRDAATSILGAGGSTRAARDLAPTALQFQRDYDMTNSAQVLGRVSGSVGGAAQTEQSTIKIMSEAVKLGLDKSEYREENRKFTQSVADTVFRVGAKDAAGAEGIASIRGSFLADKTGRGLEAANSMAQFTASLQQQQSGLRPAIEAGYMFSDKNFSNLNTDQMLALQGMSSEDIAALQGPELDVLTSKTGLSREDLVKKSMRMKTIKTLGPNVDLLSQRDTLQKEVEGSGLSYDQALEDPRFRERFGSMGLALRGRMLPAGTGQAESASLLKSFFMNPDQAINQATKMPTATSGRVGDVVVGQQAGFEGAMNALQNEFTPGIMSAAEASKKAAQEFASAAELLKKAKTDLERLEIIKTLSDKSAGLGIPSMSAVQPQSAPAKGN